MQAAKTKEKIVIDLKGMSLGRAASRAAVILRGKNRPDFAPNRSSGTIIEIKNLDQLKIEEKKAEQKFYKHYSGYPSGLKETKLAELYKKNPKEVFVRAVRGMLARNRLRKELIKNIVFSV